MKLSGGAGTTVAAASVKVDNATARRRPKSTKRKKPGSDTTTPSTTTGGAPPSSVLHPGAAGGGTDALPPGARLDGLTTPGAQSDSGVKLETGSIGAGDDSGINMSDTWQRNGHSADFIRQSIGQFASSISCARVDCMREWSIVVNQ